MFAIEPPSPANLTRVLDAVLSDEHNRETVVTWAAGVQSQFPENSYSLLLAALAACNIPFDPDGGTGYFIRDRDLEEYRADLLLQPCQDAINGVRRLRRHELGQPLFKPVMRLVVPDFRVFDRMGLYSVRGIGDTGDPIEHVHLHYDGAYYYILRQYDDQADTLYVFATDTDATRMREFFERLPFVQKGQH